MIPKYINLALGNGKKLEIIKIFEPTIFNLGVIEKINIENKLLLENKKKYYSEYIKCNNNYILQLLGIDKKYITFTTIILDNVLKKFFPGKEESKETFLWGDLKYLAGLDGISLGEFIRTYNYSIIGTLGKTLEFENNIKEGKTDKNIKFTPSIGKTEKERIAKEIEQFNKEKLGS